MSPILYYVHDPMCSWCWGFSQTLAELLEQLPQEIKVRRVLGGLAPDTETPMSEEMKQQLQRTWSLIEDKIPGIKFNFDFWVNNQPRRSTYPACRAVIAACQQGDKYDELMTKEIQKAYYQEAKNPSDNNVLIKLAGILNLDIEKFKEDLNSEKTKNILDEHIALSRELYAESFPSLVLKIGDKAFTIPIDYNDSSTMLAAINRTLNIK